MPMDITASYAQFTQDIVDVTGLARPMLHILAGLAIYLPSLLFFGTRRGSLLAVMLILQIELCNELLNMLHYGSWRWADTIADVILTLLGPVMCCVISNSKQDISGTPKQTGAEQLKREANDRADRAHPRLVAVRIRSSEGYGWDRASPIQALPIAA